MNLHNVNLDNTSHASRSKPDEPVPSRYVQQVGDIEVLVVSDGVLPLPTAMLAHNIDPTVRAAWLDDMYLPPDAFDWALNVVVVRSGHQTILVDAGLGLDPDLHLPRAGQLIKRLEAAGIDLAEVTDVVFTHMHMDHIGGLCRGGEGPAASRPADPRRGRRGQVLGGARFLARLHAAGFPGRASADRPRFIKEYRSHLRTFEDEYEVAPGVVVHRTGGHTPGHSVVRVASAGEALMFAGDLVFAAGFEHPDWHNGFEPRPQSGSLRSRRPVRIQSCSSIAGF